MAKVKDNRIDAVKLMIENKALLGLRMIFDIIPKNTVAKGTGIHYATIYKKIEHPALWKVEELILLAEYIKVTPQEIMTLVLHDMNYKSATR